MTMFCPRCATENDWEKAYCRQCGQALSDVRLGLQGAPSESVAKLKSGSHVMNGGLASVLVFTVIATTLALLGIFLGQPVLSTIAMMNALLGVLIGMPLIIVGKSRIRAATRLLSSNSANKALGPEHESDQVTAHRQAQLDQRLPVSSITEHTTLDLNRQRKP